MTLLDFYWLLALSMPGTRAAHEIKTIISYDEYRRNRDTR